MIVERKCPPLESSSKSIRVAIIILITGWLLAIAMIIAPIRAFKERKLSRKTTWCLVAASISIAVVVTAYFMYAKNISQAIAYEATMFGKF